MSMWDACLAAPAFFVLLLRRLRDTEEQHHVFSCLLFTTALPARSISHAGPINPCVAARHAIEMPRIARGGSMGRTTLTPLKRGRCVPKLQLAGIPTGRLLTVYHTSTTQTSCHAYGDGMHAHASRLLLPPRATTALLHMMKLTFYTC